MNDLIELEKTYGAHNYAPFPVVLVQGLGALLFDEGDKAYLDMMAGYSATNLGHCHPRILQVLNEQASKLSVTSRMYHNDILPKFLKKLCAVTGLDVALPMNTGAEAVETAIKIARRWGYWNKKIFDSNALIVVMDNNFHGRTTTIVGFSSESSYSDGFGPFDGGFYWVPFSSSDRLARLLEQKGKNIAAVLLEPIQGEAGIIVPDYGYLQKVRKLCSQHNVLMIADEVQSGLGRTGKWFACNHEDVTPDLMIVGKALGGGVLPVSAVVGHREVMEVMTPGSHGSTFGGNPLAAAVGLETLKVLEEERLIEAAHDTGMLMQMRLAKINSPVVKQVRGIGLWGGIELIPEIPAKIFVKMLIKKGVITINSHNTIRLSPPLVISDEQLHFALDKIEEVCKDLE